jgi:LDH2 family malate/lactate/ureidoglycolate dehydrogenase
LDAFASSMDEYIDKIKGLKKASFTSDIYLPGEIEYKKEMESKVKGISLDEKTVKAINEMLEQLGIQKHLDSIT